MSSEGWGCHLAVVVVAVVVERERERNEESQYGSKLSECEHTRCLPGAEVLRSRPGARIVIPRCLDPPAMRETGAQLALGLVGYHTNTGVGY